MLYLMSWENAQIEKDILYGLPRNQRERGLRDFLFQRKQSQFYFSMITAFACSTATQATSCKWL